ncbi:hypothetical protein HBZ99_004563 [Salmonella enterica subsp. enterica]|uniref:Uncharacterized protein n=1 Tax=Salmonella enterica I TaxID=59201 RepID=A0A403MPC3_SALET|nr:hypothetical protein [Salmonella enterica subsp. enterica serovar Oranienburg]EDV3838499.1 hypothetical protein [Salmonella enterica subsp. diarizonae]EHI3196385.1 hypothetical protein [Salmonella enterica]EIG0952031.1 hypothetical protein [Salmonella enterica subsp. enterica serovar Muenchen]EED9398008.1 hypothetical protein [Salmonella enterica subsp. enterica serovar Oranienburg]
MNNEEIFSLSYEQLLQVTEEHITEFLVNRNGEDYALAPVRACDTLDFWNTLAIRGWPGLPDVERVNSDFNLLISLISKFRKENALPSVTSPARRRCRDGG